MPEIDNPIVNKFLNEVARPGAERVRRLAEQQLADAVARYDIDIEEELEGVDDSTVIADGREAEGISPRTVGELKEIVRAFRLLTTVAQLDGITGVTAVQAQSNLMSEDNVPETMRKFTVRSAIFGD